MGLFDSIKKSFVEEIEEEVDVSSPDARLEDDTPVSDIPEDVTSVTISEDIVSEAYRKFANSSINIFVVEELVKNFEGIPEATRNSMLCKNLKTLGHDVALYQAELQQRKDEIEKVTAKQKSICESTCADIDIKIAEAKKLIDSLSSQKLDLQNNFNAACAGAEKELQRLNNISSIIGGTN